MEWQTLLFWAGSAVVLVFAVVTVIRAPGRRHDPGLEEDPPADH